jgi:tetratricopeptide (TPR) repeat protein
MTMAGAGQASLLADALHSAPFADIHLVLDTSPDQPAVRAALDEIAKDGRPQKITLKQWAWREDFSAARNELFRATERVVDEDGGPDGDTWGVVLDSDERLVCSDALSVRSELLGVVAQTCTAFDTTGFYAKERCFRLPTKAYYIGPTHEACDNRGTIQDLKSLRFWELGKSHHQYQAKLARDEKILKRHIKKNPCDPRWHYYYADTLSSLGKKKEALAEFVECGKLKGWDEESAWAYYRAAEILLEMGRFGECVEMAAKGLTRHAGIAELSWLAAVASFRAGWSDKATYWAQLSISMGDHVGAAVSKKRILFRKHEALYELPYDVLRFSLPTEEERLEAEREFWKAKTHRFGGTAEECALRRTDAGSRWEARKDLGRLCKSLPEVVKDLKIYPIPNPSEKGYHAMNPSIFAWKAKLWVVIRTVNYTMDDGGNYIPRKEDGDVIKTENYLGLVDPKDFSTSGVRQIMDKTGGERFPTRVLGYEDLRPVAVGKKLFGCATVRDHSSAMPCDIAVCELSADGDVAKDWVQNSNGRPEKNWMPMSGLSALTFLYSIDPTRVVRFDTETGQCSEVASSVPLLGLDHLRGGSQAVALKGGGWLVVTHEVVILDDKRRYLHRFVRLDADYRVKSVSKAWRLRPQVSVEFVAGMVVLKDQLVLSVGLDDKEACLVVMPIEEGLRLAGEVTGPT